jgi:hypothetical protein
MSQVYRRQPVVCRFTLCLFGLAIAVGCTGSAGLPNTVPVSGKVTYKGQAVNGATISFIGDKGLRPATAITGADGSYELNTLDAKGAMPGKYRVVVNKMDNPAGPARQMTPEEAAKSMDDAAKEANKPLAQPKNLLPAKYSDAAKTPLNFEVKSGESNTVNLDLTD